MVQVRDDVECGDERIREMEQELRDVGLFDTEFGLGDVLDEEEEQSQPSPSAKPRSKAAEFPVTEGEESVVEYVGQYKRACLSRKALCKAAQERLEKDKATGFEHLGCIPS